MSQVLHEGWLQKKGTGGDLLGRDSWKNRYAFLVLATNADLNQEIEVPLLLIYRNTSVTMPSNIIPLDSAVVMTRGEQLQQQGQNKTVFDIVQARQSKYIPCSDTKQTRRSFTAPGDETKDWVETINSVLIEFEKRRAIHKKNNTTNHASASNTVQQEWPNLDFPESR